MSSNPNRGKRKASPASARTLRTSLRLAPGTGGSGTSRTTLYRVDPALLRRVGAERAVAIAERGRDERAVVVARNRTGRGLAAVSA